jgi:hypothetical protein
VRAGILGAEYRQFIGIRHPIESVLGDDVVHVVTDAVAQVVAEPSNAIQALQERGPAIRGQSADGLAGLVEYPH